MVRMQSIVRVLLVAAMAVSATGVRADDAETQTTAAATTKEQTCVAPEVVANFETKIDALETERAQWESQLVAANGKWKKEKSELEAKLTQEQTRQKDAHTEWTRAQEEAGKVVTTLEKQLSDRDVQHAQAVKTLELQMGERKSDHTATLAKLHTQVATLEQTVQKLQTQLAEHKAAAAKRDTDVADANAKLAKSQHHIKSLEHDVASSLKKNKLLRDELEKLDEKLTVSALLSSYYDEGIVLASDAVTALRLQLESAQDGSTPSVTQALEALETYKKTVTDTTDKLYNEHLAATLDPLIADLQTASHPYLKQYRPLIEDELIRAQKAAVKTYHVARARGLAARADAIALLQQTDGVAPYAQPIVDGSLVVLTAPIAWVVVRLVLSLAWFIVRTFLCVVTCGWCCGACGKKRSKAKRKTSRKPLSPSQPPTNSAVSALPSAKKTTATPATSNAKRTGSGKKQK